MPHEGAWWVYVLECEGDRLYVGSASDVVQRFRTHQSGKGAVFTRLHAPIRVIAIQAFDSRKEATGRERKLKKLTYDRKMEWVRLHPPMQPVERVVPGSPRSIPDVPVAR